MSHPAQLADRKKLLVAQSELQRMQALLAWQDLRVVVSPAPHRGSRARTFAATALGIALPFLGAGRLRRIVRIGSIGLMVLRAVKGWTRR